MKDQFIKKQINLLLLLLIIVISLINNLHSFENKIIYRVNNEIITSLDVENEMNYLLALNPNLNNLNKNEVIKISKKSILKEKIKKIEIENIIADKNLPKKYLEQLLQNIYSKIGIANIDDFKKYLKTKDVSYNNVIKKITVEALWNEIIILKYSTKLKINESKLKKEIEKIKNKNLKSFLMSEIFFEINNNENLDKKYNEIKKTINEKGFGNAALKYSNSQTSNIGGRLNWINENSLNDDVKKIINSLEINDYTGPIRVTGGFLVLKLNDLKIVQSKIDLEQELKKRIRSLKNDQLNQFSKMHFNKVKKNIRIDEI